MNSTVRKFKVALSQLTEISQSLVFEFEQMEFEIKMAKEKIKALGQSYQGRRVNDQIVTDLKNEGLNNTQIADAMGCTVRTVRYALARERERGKKTDPVAGA